MHTTSNTVFGTNHHYNSNTSDSTASVHILQAFNSFAMAHRFTGVQTQLWNHLYWLVCTYGQGVCIPTYHLLETMGISRSQLHRARKALMDAGCLAVHKSGAQRLHYTVMLDGEIIGENNVKPQNNGALYAAKQTGNEMSERKKGHANYGTSGSLSPTKPKTTGRKNSAPTGVVPQSDVVMNGEIVHMVKAFTAQYGYSAVAQRKLIQWCDMRKKSGWTMTAAGVNSTMTALQLLCKGEEEMLIKIVDRTLQHHWKGFHPYRVDAAPSGKAYTAWQPQNAYSGGKRRQGAIPAYETERVDLSFLER